VFNDARKPKMRVPANEEIDAAAEDPAPMRRAAAGN